MSPQLQLIIGYSLAAICAIGTIYGGYLAYDGHAKKRQQNAESDQRTPQISMLIKNEHRNYDDGANVFGIKWKKEYSSHIIEIRNENREKSIKQLSLVLAFNSSILYRDIVIEKGAKGIKAGKDMAAELQVTGPLFANKKPKTKVMAMKPANIFNPTVDELFPEGLVSFRVILSKDEAQEIFFTTQYYYESGDRLEKAVFEGKMFKDETFAKFPNLKEINKK